MGVFFGMMNSLFQIRSMGSSQAVRQGPLKPPCEGSIPSSPANRNKQAREGLFLLFERRELCATLVNGSGIRLFSHCIHTMTKKYIYFFLFLGSAIGSYVPALWGDDVFSMSSILLSGIGGLVGIYIGYVFGQRFD